MSGLLTNEITTTSDFAVETITTNNSIPAKEQHTTPNTNTNTSTNTIDDDIVEIIEEEYELSKRNSNKSAKDSFSSCSSPYSSSFVLSDMNRKCHVEEEEESYRSEEFDDDDSSSSSEMISFHYIPSSSHANNNNNSSNKQISTNKSKNTLLNSCTTNNTITMTNTTINNKDVIILGRQYSSLNDYTLIHADELSLFWFTYRRDFSELVPYGLTTDAGWGCMLRATQMMLCQALRLHHVGRHWRTSRSPVQRRNDPFIRDVMHWFADYSGVDCSFSLHNMIAAGIRYEMLPGEWYGPTTSCYVLRDLCSIHQQQQQQKRGTKAMFRVLVAQEGCVYRDVLEETMTVDSCEKMNQHDSTTTNASTCNQSLPKHPLDTNHDDANITLAQQVPWDTALLLLIPLRLGLKSFPTSYHNQLAQIFTLPQSVGCIGGSPRHALWFYGSITNQQNQNKKLYALDPHTVQMAPQRDYKNRHGAISLSNEYISSVTCSSPVVIDMDRMDPSLALGFYCTDREDFDLLQCSLQHIYDSTTVNQQNILFRIMDAAPDYTCNVSVLADMMSSRGEEVDGSYSEDADDDYVFL